jgi:flagellar hook protein FlgE
MKFQKLMSLNVVLTVILIILFVVPTHALRGNEYRADNQNKLISPKTPGISGCIDLKGYSLANSTVILKQKGEHKQMTKTDVDGCYEFKQTAPNKSFTIIITGQPEVVVPSTNVLMYLNLDSRASIPSEFNVNNPDATSYYSTFITVYDSLGSNHDINIYFRKASESPSGNTWQWFAVVNGSDSSSGSIEIQAQGTLDFDSNGAIEAESAITYPTIGFDFNGGAMQDQVIVFDFGVSIVEGGTGYEGTTQFGTVSTLIYLVVN